MFIIKTLITAIMEHNLNRKLIEAVTKSPHAGKNPVSYLKDLLNISKESVYRRLNDQVPFTFQEAAIIATDLKFSIDKIIMPDGNIPGGTIDIPAIFTGNLNHTVSYVKKISAAGSTKILMSVNTLSFLTLLLKEELCKFLYYKTLHQLGAVPLCFPYSELQVPAEIRKMQKEFNYYLNNSSPEIIYIFDKTLFQGIVDEILYYHSRRLIKVQELEILKENLLGLLQKYEDITWLGNAGNGPQYSFYFSGFKINSNILHCECDDDIFSQYWINTMNPVNIHDRESCMIQKKWIESLKKYSTLITQANEMMQTDFLDKQRALINAIDTRLSGKI